METSVLRRSDKSRAVLENSRLPKPSLPSGGDRHHTSVQQQISQRCASLTRELHTMGLVGFREHEQYLGVDEGLALYNLACRAQARKERLAKAAELPTSAAAARDPDEAKKRIRRLRRAMGQPRGMYDHLAVPEDAVPTAPSRSRKAYDEARRWEIRLNRSQGQLGVWEGGVHATKSMQKDNAVAEHCCSDGSAVTHLGQREAKFINTSNAPSDKPAAHPKSIPYLNFTPVPQWLLQPSSWHVSERADLKETSFDCHSQQAAITQDASDGAYSFPDTADKRKLGDPTGYYWLPNGDDAEEELDDCYDGRIAQALLRSRQRPPNGNLHVGPVSLHFSEPPVADA